MYFACFEIVGTEKYLEDDIVSFEFIDGRMYMMPVQFGPVCGPRANPDGNRFIYDQPQESTQHMLVYETDGAKIERFLPKGFELEAPYVIVTHKMHRNLAWLAGHGYNVCTFDVPVIYQGKTETIKGLFLLNIWENHADPIICGREQLGYSKIFSSISDLDDYHGKSRSVLSSWDFQFLELNFDFSQSVEDTEELMHILNDPERKGKLHYKYFPRTGDGFISADVEYVTISPSPTIFPPDVERMPPAETACGTGSLTWNIPEWKDMPTQYHIVQALASLDVKRVIGAYRKHVFHLADVYDQRIVD